MYFNETWRYVHAKVKDTEMILLYNKKLFCQYNHYVPVLTKRSGIWQAETGKILRGIRVAFGLFFYSTSACNARIGEQTYSRIPPTLISQRFKGLPGIPCSKMQRAREEDLLLRFDGLDNVATLLGNEEVRGRHSQS